MIGGMDTPFWPSITRDDQVDHNGGLWNTTIKGRAHYYRGLWNTPLYPLIHYNGL